MESDVRIKEQRNTPLLQSGENIVDVCRYRINYMQKGKRKLCTNRTCHEKKVLSNKAIWYKSLDLAEKEKLLSHKLRCYTRISRPEKSRNNTREKISYFFTCVDIANQLLTRHSPLALLGQVDE